MRTLSIRTYPHGKECTRCREALPWSAYRILPRHSTGYRSMCRNCENATRKRPKHQPRPATLIRYKGKVLDHYGAKCSCCNEANTRFLSVDHIDDNGHDHKGRGKHRYKGETLYRLLVRLGFPAGIRILCFNCNIGRRNNKGTCPHRDEIRPDPRDIMAAHANPPITTI